MSEFIRVNRAATQALTAGETVCLATVIRSKGSAPRHVGARMLILPSGDTHGTIGGGTLEHSVIKDALRLLPKGHAELKNYVFDPRGRPDSVGLCGGAVDILMEILRPDPTLLIVGAGHIAKPLAQMAALLDMRVSVVDDREDWANPKRFPDASEIHVIDYEPNMEILAPIPTIITSTTYVVITTWGYDLPALEQALDAKPAFIGLVASPVKARELFQRLLSKGISAETLRQVHTPAGLDIGAESPAEVALSVLAEIISTQRDASGTALRVERGQILEKLLSKA
ncbi:MAG: XdhC/CoxI family protein [Anaerolineales bacterium]|nr:XdhC/CoxI family protein [Anaerolineales bacterium]